jgi:2-oxoglutarate dehydrogenase E2 component (dihydrolipoamide succinyltransferase)
LISDSDKFFSFSENIASTEVSVAELEQINGTGKDGRVTKMIF